MLVAQSCPTLCDPIDCSPPGSSVHGIFQAAILEWIAIPFSGDSFRPRGRTRSLALQVDSLLSKPPEKPISYRTDLQIFPKTMSGFSSCFVSGVMKVCFRGNCPKWNPLKWFKQRKADFFRWEETAFPSKQELGDFRETQFSVSPT